MIENPGSAVLHPAATGLEKAMADTDAVRLMAIYAEAIIDVWDPYRVSLENLPYLAWAMGVNLWDDAWREITKRTWTARQWEFKSLRGTAAGIRMAVDYVGRDVSPFGYQVLAFTTPPQQVFSGPTLTREEREAWLATLPQIRVWRIREQGSAGPRKAFLGSASSGAFHARRCFLDGNNAAIESSALQRLRRRARYIERGVETAITVTEFGNYWRVHLRSVEDSKVFCDRPIYIGHAVRRRFYIPTTAPQRLITVWPTPRLSWRSPVWPTMEPIAAEPERIVERGTWHHQAFCDRPMRGGSLAHRPHFVPTDAWRRIYDRFAINDGSGDVARRRPVQFMGRGYYGWPKYTEWVRLSLRNRRRFSVFSGSPMRARGRRFFLPHDGTPVKRAKRAVMASKKLVDKVWLQLGPVPRFVAGRPFVAGVDEFIVGSAF
jgi:phage tail P2-like protein